MNFDIEILQCPLTGEDLHLIKTNDISDLPEEIMGYKKALIPTGLVNTSQTYFYPIIDDIEAEIGVKFEDLTKSIFLKLGFQVDEELRKKLNTPKDKIDIVINLGNNEVILVECKSVKESGYNKFSSVHRQLKAYRDLVKLNNYKVIKSLLVAPEFTDQFINDCEIEYELNLSLIKASSLIGILEGFKESKHKNCLMSYS